MLCLPKIFSSSNVSIVKQQESDGNDSVIVEVEVMLFGGAMCNVSLFCLPLHSPSGTMYWPPD